MMMGPTKTEPGPAPVVGIGLTSGNPAHSS